jgi:hypothetical protein
MNLTIEEKNKIYDFISSIKDRFIYKKLDIDKLSSLNRIFLELEYDLKFDKIKSCFEFLTEHWDKKCKSENCLNKRKITSLFPNREDFNLVRKKYGIYKFCDDPRCNYKSISDRQLGENNTSHRMSSETFKSMCDKNSIKMKANIRDGKFIPNVTNSWAKSRCEIEFYRGNEFIKTKTRSTWEAYFQLFNVDLIYEKVIIPYKYKGVHHNYIVDFVDTENKILYEIKPLSNIDDDKVRVKIRYARKWCKLTNYKFVLITDKWFIRNYNETIVNGQPSEDKIVKNLKQFKR